MSKRLQADLALAACMFIWGATFVVVQNALVYASVFAFLSVRFVLAALVMLAIYWNTVRRLARAEIIAGAVIGIFLFSGYVFQTVALKFTTPSKAAFLNGSSAVFVPVLLAVFWRKRINRWAWAGALGRVVRSIFRSRSTFGFRKSESRRFAQHRLGGDVCLPHSWPSRITPLAIPSPG